jgi:hypothetical protein
MVPLLDVLPPESNVSEARKGPETLPDEEDSKVSRYPYQTLRVYRIAGPGVGSFLVGRAW